MRDHDIGHAAIGNHASEEDGQRFNASSRGTDTDDRKGLSRGHVHGTFDCFTG
jgi:hypothetical protein